MRNLLILGGAVLMLAAFGCSSNPAGSITGPSQTFQLNLPAGEGSSFDPNDEFIGPPKYIELESSAPAGAPTVAPGFYGTVSNLSAGGFTLTSPDGRTLKVTFTPETKVVYQGTMTSPADSPLEDGMNVSVRGTVAGLPQHATVRGMLVVINSSLTNQTLVNPD